MISSAKEARRIINAYNTTVDPMEIETQNVYEAKGYLACLEGPEVKALVEALESIQRFAKLISWKIPRGISIYAQNPEYKFACLLSEIELASDNSLAQYREAIKR